MKTGPFLPYHVRELTPYGWRTLARFPICFFAGEYARNLAYEMGYQLSNSLVYHTWERYYTVVDQTYFIPPVDPQHILSIDYIDLRDVEIPSPEK